MKKAIRVLVQINFILSLGKEFKGKVNKKRKFLEIPIILLAAIATLMGCSKQKGPQYDWAINFADGSGNYQFVGNSTKQAQQGDRAVFGALAGYGRLPNGKLAQFTAQTNFDTYDGNPQKMGFSISLMNYDTVFLRNIDPQGSNNLTQRLASLQQWLTNKIFRLSPTTAELKVYYKDALGQEWVEDINSSGEATVTGVAPFSLPGYSQSLRANIQFNINMVRYSNTAPYTVLGRQTIDGNMMGFFTLDE